MNMEHLNLDELNEMKSTLSAMDDSYSVFDSNLDSTTSCGKCGKACCDYSEAVESVE